MNELSFDVTPKHSPCNQSYTVDWYHTREWLLLGYTWLYIYQVAWKTACTENSFYVKQLFAVQVLDAVWMISRRRGIPNVTLAPDRFNTSIPSE